MVQGSSGIREGVLLCPYFATLPGNLGALSGIVRHRNGNGEQPGMWPGSARRWERNALIGAVI